MAASRRETIRYVWFLFLCLFGSAIPGLDSDDEVVLGDTEKQKCYYLTFAPFIYRGVTYPAVTIAYSAYIDGFLSRYSFEPISYLATEDTLHLIKARELDNPDFFGDFSFWQTSSSTSSFVWLLNSGNWNDLGYWVDDEFWID